MGVPLSSSDFADILTSSHGISKKIYPLLLPLTSLAWSISFRPSSQDLPLMMFHGTMAMCLSWAGVPLFLAASAVTFSSAIISRITGKNALASTLAGLYALVPGYVSGCDALCSNVFSRLGSNLIFVDISFFFLIAPT